jgi:predicted methyltransferase
MVGRDQLGIWLDEIHRSLKADGTLGVVQHRGVEGADPKESAAKGYLPEAWLIEQIESHGFKLVEKSELLANPRDTKDYADGVWALPPSLRYGETDRAKYEAIGESDRMTLRFKKVTAKP